MSTTLEVHHFQLPDRYEEEHLLVHAETIIADLGSTIRASDFERLWNEKLFELLAIEAVHPRHKWYVGDSGPEHYFLIPKLFFAVLGNYIKEDDEIELIIPESLSYKVFFIGWRLERGVLRIKGNAGGAADDVSGNVRVIVEDTIDTVADGAHGNSQILVKGDVTHSAGFRAYGNTSVEIFGDVGHQLGGGALEGARFVVHGNVGWDVAQAAKGHTSFLVKGNAAQKEMTSVGSNISDSVHVEIMGNVGGGVGIEATGDSEIIVHGNAGKFVGYGAKSKARIIIKGSVGDRLGEKAQGHAYIEVFGDAGDKIGQRAYRTPTIIVHGQGKTGTPNPSFKGILKVGN